MLAQKIESAFIKEGESLVLKYEKDAGNSWAEYSLNNYRERKFFRSSGECKEKYALGFALSRDQSRYYSKGSWHLSPVLQYLKRDGTGGRVIPFSEVKSIRDTDKTLLKIAFDIKYQFHESILFSAVFPVIISKEVLLFSERDGKYHELEKKELQSVKFDLLPCDIDENRKIIKYMKAVISAPDSVEWLDLNDMLIEKTYSGHAFLPVNSNKIFVYNHQLNEADSFVHLFDWLNSFNEKIDISAADTFKRSMEKCADRDRLIFSFTAPEYTIQTVKPVITAFLDPDAGDCVSGYLNFDYDSGYRTVEKKKKGNRRKRNNNSRVYIRKDRKYEKEIFSMFLDITGTEKTEFSQKEVNNAENADNSKKKIKDCKVNNDYCFKGNCPQDNFILNYAEDLIESGFKIRFYDNDEIFRRMRFKIEIDASSGIDWFDFSAVMRDEQGKFEKIEIDPALLVKNLVRRKGKLVIISRENREILQKLAARIRGENNSISRYDLSLIETLFNSIIKPSEEIKNLYNAARSLANPEKIQNVKPGDNFNGKLRAYQKTGLNWLWVLNQNNLNGCLADDMGLGKTIQTLALLSRLKEDKMLDQVLLIVPLTTAANWENEIKRFCPGISFVRHHGSNREKQLDNYKGKDIIITTYGTMRSDILLFMEKSFSYIILDEAQNIKNRRSQTFKAARMLKSDNRLSLTGTPVENCAAELWAQMDFLNPGLLGSYRMFTNEYQINMDESGPGKDLAAEQLRRKVGPFMLRRKKDEVLKDLPEKEIIHCFLEMDDNQSSFYEALKTHYQKELVNALSSFGSAEYLIKLLQGLLRLRQAACMPSIINKEYKKVSSVKLEALNEKLDDILGGDHKVLVFSQFTSILYIIEGELHRKGTDYCYLDGKTDDRAGVIDDFQNNPEKKVFLISLKAGGVGINLTAADYVIVFDPWWNPAVENQAIDRAHRIGQEKKVTVIKMIVKNTIEEKIIMLQEKKQELADKLVGCEEGFIKSLTREDLKFIFE